MGVGGSLFLSLINKGLHPTMTHAYQASGHRQKVL